MPLSSEIVVVSSDVETHSSLTEILTRLGFDPICATTIRQCGEILGAGNVGLVFCDRNLADGGYQDLLAVVAAGAAKPPVVLLAHEAGEYQEARQAGVFEAIATPCRPTDVEWMLIQAGRIQMKQLLAAEADNRTLKAS